MSDNYFDPIKETLTLRAIEDRDEHIRELEALLREFVACATALGNGEMFCKVEDSMVEEARRVLGGR